MMKRATAMCMVMFGSFLLLPGVTPAETVALPKTGQLSSYVAGDDGATRFGVAWPDPRFTDLGDGTVADSLTGLIWAKNAGTPTVGTCMGGRKTWPAALSYVDCLNSNAYLGYTDWLLPNINELKSLADAERSNPALADGHPFTNVSTFIYWSSTTVAHATGSAWDVHMGKGDVFSYYKTAPYDVWPVREKSWSSAAVSLLRTGQTVSYAGRDDGARQRGHSWPAVRFADNGDGTVTDLLTGLIWLKQADCFPLQPWFNAFNSVTSLAQGVCGLNDGSTSGDWRLPNRDELLSLIDRSRTYPSLPAGHPFTGIQTYYYWTSTTAAFDISAAWGVYLNYGGYLDFHDKSTIYSGSSFILAVRNAPAPVADADGDSVADAADNCPNLANADQADFDLDGIGDLCDPDNDNDGVADADDLFPFDPTEWSDSDGDGVGDNTDPVPPVEPVADADGDGVVDAGDNCPNLANADQADFDQDGLGDLCDPDDDNDGVTDADDAFPRDPAEWADANGNGIGDNADAANNPPPAELVVAVPGKLVIPHHSTTGTFQISWGASATDGVNYELERSSDRGKSWGTEAQYPGGPQTFADLSTLPNGSYTWRVKAVRKGYLDSPWRNGGKVGVKTGKK